MEKDGITPTKFAALITYISGALMLIVGFVLPFTSSVFQGAAMDFSKMPLMSLAAAFASVFGTGSGAGIYSCPVSFYGAPTFDVGALLFLLLALATVVYLVILIPACIANRKNTGIVKLMAVGEILAVAVLGAMTTVNFYRAAEGSEWNFSVIFPFLFITLMLMIQSCIYRTDKLTGERTRKSGAMKIVLAVISLISFAFILFPPYFLIPALAEPFAGLASGMGISPAMIGNANGFELADTIFTLGNTLTSVSLLPMLTMLSGGIACALVIINCFLDIFGLGKDTNGFMLFCNVVRYALEFVGAAVALVLAFVLKWVPGILIYALMGVSFIQLIINIVRFAVYMTKRARLNKEKTAKKKKTEEAERADALVGTSADFGGDSSFDEPVATPAAAATAAASETAAEGVPSPAGSAPAYVAPDQSGVTVETKNVVYNVNTIYHGPTDSFIKKLSNDEKVEFARTFLERSAGNLTGIPEYVVGGNNTRFFSSVFIYFARVRDLVSDGLMNKLYEEVNLMGE